MKRFINSKYFPNDKVPIKVSACGTLYVEPLYWFFTQEELRKKIREARREKLIKDLRRMAGNDVPQT